MARARSALWATLVGSLIGFVGGFLHAPSCGGRSAPAVRPRLLELAHPSCAVGGPVERHQRAGSPRTAFQRGMVLRAKSVDKNESDLPEDALGIVTPGGKVDVDPYVSRISTHANNEGKTEAEGRRKLRWRIFNRDYDKEIVSMAVPSYTAVLLDPIATLIDITFIGRLPDSALSLAGVGISNTILNYFSFLFFFMVVTTTTSVAQALARSSSALSSTEFEDHAIETAAGRAEGSRIIAGSMLCSLAMGVASASLCWILAPKLVALIGSSRSADAASYAVAYMRNKCLGIPAMIVFFSVIGAFRGYKDLRTPLIGNVFSSITKVVLGYVFLFQLHLGVAGAGLADAMARYLSLGVLLTLLVSSGRLKLGDLLARPGGDLVRDLVTPGGALTVRKMIEQICFTMTMRFSASFGATAVASAEIARQCWSVLSILWWPLSVAGQTMVAAALAEFSATQRHKKLVLARGIAIRVMYISSILGAFGACVIIAGRNIIPSLLTPSEAVQTLSAMQLPFLALIMPVTALCDVVESCFIAAKDYKVVLQAMLCGAVALTVTIGVCNLLEFGVRTQWLAILALYCARLALGLRRFNSSRSSIPREENFPALVSPEVGVVQAK